MYEQLEGGPLSALESTGGRRSPSQTVLRRRRLRGSDHKAIRSWSIIWTLVPALLISLGAGIVAAPQAAAATTTDVVLTASEATFVARGSADDEQQFADVLGCHHRRISDILEVRHHDSSPGKTITAARLELSIKQISVTQPGLIAYPSSSSVGAPPLSPTIIGPLPTLGRSTPRCCRPLEPSRRFLLPTLRRSPPPLPHRSRSCTKPRTPISWCGRTPPTSPRLVVTVDPAGPSYSEPSCSRRGCACRRRWRG